MRTFLTGLAATLLSTAAAQAADDVTLQLKWVTQAQFAGYYVALDKGFYEAEGLNVTIKPGGPDHRMLAGTSQGWFYPVLGASFILVVEGVLDALN